SPRMRSIGPQSAGPRRRQGRRTRAGFARTAVDPSLSMMTTKAQYVCVETVSDVCRPAAGAHRWRPLRRRGIIRAMRRIAVQLGFAVLAMAATAGLAFGGPTRPPNGGFHGVVYRGPTSPVCRSNEPCEAPAAGVTLRFARSGSATRSVTTARDGSYRILLPAAIYQVTT